MSVIKYKQYKCIIIAIAYHGAFLLHLILLNVNRVPFFLCIVFFTLIQSLTKVISDGK